MLSGGGGSRQVNAANPDLKWEKSAQLNAGIDFSIIHNRLSGSIDYFNKKTSDLLFNFIATGPGPAANVWRNMPGEIHNRGVELALRGEVIRGKDLLWNLGVNAAFMKNELNGYEGPDVLTGAISGQGVSGATIQRFANGYPLNVFYMRKWTGLNKDGISEYEGGADKMFYSGDPNPAPSWALRQTSA